MDPSTNSKKLKMHLKMTFLFFEKGYEKGCKNYILKVVFFLDNSSLIISEWFVFLLAEKFHAFLKCLFE